MQIGLTFVVGQGVIVEGNAWRQTLVGVQVDDQISEGQVTKDTEELSFFATGFDKFLGGFDQSANHLKFNQTGDEQAQKNEDLIHDLERRLAEKNEEKNQPGEWVSITTSQEIQYACPRIEHASPGVARCTCSIK